VSSRHNQSIARPGGLVEGTGDAILVSGLVLVVLATVGTWLTGQLAALLFLGHWPTVSFAQAMQALFRLPGHLADPRDAWPLAVRGELPGTAAMYFAAMVALGVLGIAAAAVVRWALRHRPQRGFASRAEIQATLSEKAVIARGPVVRPSRRGRRR
jgi:type IV secretion system protein VirD4